MNWQAILDKINQWLDKIQAKLQELVDKVNSILARVPGWAERLLDGFMALWDKMLAKLDEFWQWIYGKLQYAGNLPWLDDTKESWHDSVGEPTYQETKNIEESDLSVDNPERWSGDAAEAYAGKIGGQKSAMEKVAQTYVTAITSALSSAHDGIRSFWIAVAVALVTLYGAFVLAVLSAATIVGAIASPEFIIGGIIAFLIAGVVGLDQLNSGMDNAREALDGSLKYNQDTWPSFAV